MNGIPHCRESVVRLGLWTDPRMDLSPLGCLAVVGALWQDT
jgi:hypothetical protein